MNRAMSLPVLTALLLLTVPGGAYAQAQAATAPDPRVESALRDAKLGFLIDEGDYRLDYKVDATRSQRVWVASGTTSLPPLEVRDVWSVAARGKGTVPLPRAATDHTSRTSRGGSEVVPDATHTRWLRVASTL